MIDNQYRGKLTILNDRVLRYRKISKDKSDTIWPIDVPARSMKGVLLLFEDVAPQQPYCLDTEAFYNPKIERVEVTIGGRSEPALFPGDVRLTDVGRGKEVIRSRQ